jgi:hypothetical protein
VYVYTYAYTRAYIRKKVGWFNPYGVIQSISHTYCADLEGTWYV